MAPVDLLTGLVRLREALDSVRFGLATDSAATASALRDETVDQLEDYVLPRLVQLDAPVLAIVGGSTGAGKSTLVNSVVGHRVSPAGVLRPTTRSPVLVHHPDDAEWFGPQRILPDLARTDTPTTEIGALHLVATEAVPRGIAILDAPDVDSVDLDNRALAAQLLAAGDLWLFVTSAARYADQVPWQVLQSAAQRSAAVAVVLDRTAPDAVEEVRGHLARMMASRGLKDSPLFTVPEAKVDADGLLDADVVHDVRRWTEEVAADVEARQAIVARTLDGAVRQVIFRAHDIADALSDQTVAADRLHKAVETAYTRAREDLLDAIPSGALLEGELLARWQQYIGTGDFARSREDQVRRIRERVVRGLRRQPQTATEVADAVAASLRSLVLQHVEAAAERVHDLWLDDPSSTVAATGGRRASMQARARAEAVPGEWQAAVVELVRDEVGGERLNPRFLALGGEGAAAAVMVAVLTSYAERDVDLGTQILTGVIGLDGVRRLTERAHADLVARVSAVLDREQRRHLDILTPYDGLAAVQAAVRAAARAVQDARNDVGVIGADHVRADGPHGHRDGG